MTSETAAKKDIQKLQRAIIDGLEDVKAQDIVVFDTEALSPLFERVIVASGTSNRQTKALAASVRDAVREAGFDKPRIEGQENGEWIIVDCGAAVAHVMQPVIRQYYRLEEIWGQKPVRLKFGAPKPVQPESKAVPKKIAKKGAGKVTKEVAPVSAKSVVRKAAKTASKAVTAKAVTKTANKATTKPVAKTTAKKAPVKKVVIGAKAAVKTVVVKPKSAAKPVAKSAAKPAAKAAPRAPGRKKA
ncbi:ribosome silencing factor RsfS [Hydrogenophaga crassostreae]|uniref:Ribosomal silencing factor RsfS n=1 Tax=Hydrogenophaga crassostreae TaxID=1763535 RepID=A0A167HYQ2_9BURK|nr:ribosome silencing factor [Hydrogenophaga crassostreae]AOW13611.1 ribosome silencing factor [Hydrogenophaga crassostreae]OAD41907.1 ribosome silencing factor RsfS [Hydrogenophaga crassostreae]